MRITRIPSALLALAAALVLTGSALAQDLGPRVKKLADGVYVHTGNGYDSNSGIILTDDGVIVIDTGQNPIESRDIMATVRKLTPLPVRIVIDTEPHGDHTTGHFVFPQAIVIAAAGGGESMRGADRAAPNRIQTMSAASPELQSTLDDIKKELKMPEYASWGSQDRMPTNVEAAYKALGGKI